MELSEDDEALAQAIALSLEGREQDAGAPSSSNPSSDAQSKEGCPSSSDDATPSSSIDEGNSTLPFSELSGVHAADNWQPNPEHLQLVISAGISENAAKRALYFTGNKSPDAALAWVLQNLENPELHQPLSLAPTERRDPRESAIATTLFRSLDDVYSETSHKMVFVVNAQLKMGVGKMAAQVGHAAVALYVQLISRPDQCLGVEAWEACGSKKVVLKGSGTEQITELKRKAQSVGMPNVIIQDAGRTQVDPGSVTVLGLFGQGSDVDRITGRLKLF